MGGSTLGKNTMYINNQEEDNMHLSNYDKFALEAINKKLTSTDHNQFERDNDDDEGEDNDEGPSNDLNQR
jgi:hypothetical protein